MRRNELKSCDCLQSKQVLRKYAIGQHRSDSKSTTDRFLPRPGYVRVEFKGMIFYTCLDKNKSPVKTTKKLLRVNPGSAWVEFTHIDFCTVNAYIPGLNPGKLDPLSKSIYTESIQYSQQLLDRTVPLSLLFRRGLVGQFGTGHDLHHYRDHHKHNHYNHYNQDTCRHTREGGRGAQVPLPSFIWGSRWSKSAPFQVQ